MNALTTSSPGNTGGRALSVFSNIESFEAAQRIAGALTSSNLVPESYRGKENMGNALIAMDMASRVGVSALVVMQNLHVIEGRPTWSAPFIISALNSCGLFSPIRFKIEKVGKKEVSFDAWEGPKGSRTKVVKKVSVDEITCHAYAIEKETGEILEGPEVSIGMAVAEGWYNRNGSKWKTMPDLMLRYRAAAFFGRLYAPHIMNGMHTDEEVRDAPEMINITPVATAEPAPEATPEEKPESRPRGVHAAMNAGKKKKAEPEAPKVEAKIIDAEATEITDDETTGDNSGSDDVFGDPDDDDYNPA